MENMPDIKDLRKMINLAEDELEKLKEDNRRKAKQKRITRALEKAYSLLNRNVYTQKEVDKHARIVWRALQDAIPVFWLWFFGFLLAGALIFAGIEAYSFIFANWDKTHHIKDIDRNLTELVTVNYEETNIVNLYDLMTVPDQVGLKNTPQKFTISNDSSKLPEIVNYDISYNVNIVEMNENASRVLNKKYLKYRITYTDYNGKEITTKIGRFSNLKRNSDGSFNLINGSQRKDATTNFSMVIWLSEDAPNSEQNTSYTFAFKVNAIINKIKP